jgi:hypothetical protein
VAILLDRAIAADIVLLADPVHLERRNFNSNTTEARQAAKANRPVRITV